MPERDLLEQVLSELASLHWEIGEISVKVDKIHALLREGMFRADGSVPPHQQPPASAQDPSPSGEFAAKWAGDWVERLANQARNLGLDVSEEDVRQMDISSSRNDEA